MSITSLYIFAKNTDATAALKGYQYQILKTIETWLQNKVSEIDETIYCDFEEDIFQKDDLLHTGKFRQLKLYSTNFSFADDEVKKAIAHFFMLYAKGDYLLDDLSFVFETNASIKNEAKGNHANLLKEWFANQDNMDDDLLGRASGLVKKILTSYVTEQSSSEKAQKDPDVQKGKELFESLTDDDFKSFTKLIKWHFKDIKPDEELEATIENIKSLIEALPYPTEQKNLAILIGRLHFEVLERATKKELADKALTNALLDSIILQIGDEEAKAYEQIYQVWLAEPTATTFITGQLYEVVHASEFCRYQKYLKAHDELWKVILKQFAEMPSAPIKYQRAAIYELCLLSLRNDFKTYLPAGTLKGNEDLINKYFSAFDFEVSEIQDALTLLIMVTTSCQFNLVDITPEEIKTWHKSFKGRLEKLLSEATNDGDRCEILSVFGQYGLLIEPDDIAVAKSYYDPIPALAANTSDFNVSRFYDTLNQFVQSSLKLKLPGFQEKVEMLEGIVAAVEPLVFQREGNFKTAKRLVTKGALYLEGEETKYYLKALDSFHDAKEHYRVSEYMRGYVLCLINIAEVYRKLGLNFAAKYYALCALWVIINSDDDALNKHAPDALLMMLMADFDEGAWLTMFQDLDVFIKAHIEFSSSVATSFEETRFLMVVAKTAAVFAFLPLLRPELQAYCDARAKELDWLYESEIKPIAEGARNSIPREEVEDKVFANTVVDQPFNDLGEKRTVSWFAFGINWEVTFNNDFDTNAAGEEFCALFQIVHAELGIQDFDFHFMQAPVKIHLVISDQTSMPIQEPSNGETKWKIYVPALKSNDGKAVQEVYSRMLGNLSVILQEISFLKPLESLELWKQFLTGRKIHAKSLLEHGYQRIYKDVFSKERFDLPKREQSLPLAIDGRFPKPNAHLPAKTDLSVKYVANTATEHITNRYKSATKHIHLTLDHYKDDFDFNLWMAELRAQCWKDWHIAIGLMNAVVAAKANDLVLTRTYKKDAQRMEAFEGLVKKSLAGTEDDNFKVISVERLQQGFDMEMNMFATKFMESLGLQSKPKFPNFEAVLDFNRRRLNFFEDDVDGLSPLAGMGIEKVSQQIDRFDFAEIGKDSPGVYYLMMGDYDKAGRLIRMITDTFKGSFVNLYVELLGEQMANLKIYNDAGRKIVIPNVKVPADLKTHIDSYNEGQQKSCVFATSNGMSELGTPIIISPGELLTVKAINFKMAESDSQSANSPK